MPLSKWNRMLNDQSWNPLPGLYKSSQEMLCNLQKHIWSTSLQNIKAAASFSRGIYLWKTPGNSFQINQGSLEEEKKVYWFKHKVHDVVWYYCLPYKVWYFPLVNNTSTNSTTNLKFTSCDFFFLLTSKLLIWKALGETLYDLNSSTQDGVWRHEGQGNQSHEGEEPTGFIFLLILLSLKDSRERNEDEEHIW